MVAPRQLLHLVGHGPEERLGSAIVGWRRLRDERRDSSQRRLLVGEHGERFGCLRVADRRCKQLGELVETSLEVVG